MRCQFLREAQVRFCSASAYKKLIIRSTEPIAERCTSAQWTTCAAAKEHREEHPQTAHCPFLQESLVQYCSLASVSKFIPYTDAAISRCNTDNHRYCAAFLEVAEPSSGKNPPPNTEVVDGIRIPGSMGFTRNHLWIEENEEGMLHLGADEFLARVLGRVDQLTYVTVKGNEQPTVLVHIQNLDLSLAFPGRISITGVNSTLRSSPQNIVTHPYTNGWLFEGKNLNGSEQLLRGAGAAAWMEEETRRLSEYVQQRLGSTTSLGTRLAADGGIPIHGLLCHLKREQALHLFNEFFQVRQTSNLSSL